MTRHLFLKISPLSHAWKWWNILFYGDFSCTKIPSPLFTNSGSNLRLNSYDSSLLEHLDQMMTTREKNCNPGGLWLTYVFCHLVSELVNELIICWQTEENNWIFQKPSFLQLTDGPLVPIPNYWNSKKNRSNEFNSFVWTGIASLMKCALVL